MQVHSEEVSVRATAHPAEESAEAAAEAVARTYVEIRAHDPELSYDASLREVLARRYEDDGRVSPAEQERMLERADGQMVELVVQILRVENLAGWTDMMVDPSLDHRTRARIRSVVDGVAGETTMVA